MKTSAALIKKVDLFLSLSDLIRFVRLPPQLLHSWAKTIEMSQHPAPPPSGLGQHTSPHQKPQRTPPWKGRTTCSLTPPGGKRAFKGQAVWGKEGWLRPRGRVSSGPLGGGAQSRPRVLHLLGWADTIPAGGPRNNWTLRQEAPPRTAHGRSSIERVPPIAFKNVVVILQT